MEHVTRIGDTRNACRILVGKPESRRPLGKPKSKREQIIKMNRKATDHEGTDQANLLRLMSSGTPEKKVMNIPVHKKRKTIFQ
jgi:hypothetical protein